MPRTRVLLFGDQTVDKLGSIRKLVHLSRHSPTLRRYLRDATDVVQTEVSKLGSAERKFFYGFDNLLALAEQNAAEGTPNEICATTLMCVARIGEMLVFEESEPGILMSADSTLHLLGFCTGLFPAAAAMVSKSISDLFKLGLEIVAMSVRLGYELWARSQMVDETAGSWAYSIVGATAPEVEATLKSFHDVQKTPPYKQAYVAVMSRSWTTIFGPPTTLETLWRECPSLGLAPKLKLAANGSVHSAHLPSLNVERILGESDLLKAPLRRNARCVSSSTCKPYAASDLPNLLRLMLDDIAKNRLRLTETVQEFVSGVHGAKEVDLFVVGPTAHTSLVQDALQSAKISVNLVQDVKPLRGLSGKREGSSLVAVVGMSARLPGAENIHEFWEVLTQGKDLHEKIPDSRFDVKAYYDEGGNKRNTISTLYGCFLKNPGLFDTRMFNISPREALQMDPIQRLLLMTTYEAMEAAGYHPGGSLSTDQNRISTYFGQATDDWRSNNEVAGIGAYYVPGVARAFYPGRLNYHFKWEGGSYSLDAACASSSTAVHLACSALLSRECDTAIAGGGNILTLPALYAGLSQGGFLSKTGNCKAFREDADGYCRGEAVGVVVLKRLEDALAENDKVLAVINGSGRNYSSDTASITFPSPTAQVQLYKHILRSAGVDPLDIGYVEMHGTGTQAGDPVEVQSVGEVFCKGRMKDNPLYVGAVKSNIGHTEAAAGIASLIKSVLILREKRIPPQPGAPFKISSRLPRMGKMHMIIPQAELPFENHSRRQKKRRIFLNNFDASGGNTCLILEEFDRTQPKSRDPRSFQIVTCSARTSASLLENKKRLLHHLRTRRKQKIVDVGYTSTARRMHYPFRAAYVLGSTEQLIETLDHDCTRSSKPSSLEEPTSVVFAFTGQGSSYQGMGKQFFETCRRFRETILLYQRICDSLQLPSVIHLISDAGSNATPEPTIVQSQLSLVFLELALADLWRSWGVEPDLLIGHSLGEYTALCVSGVLSVTDTFYLIGRRSSLLAQKCTPHTHAMLATKASPEILQKVWKSENLRSCEISCRNTPAQRVVSGTVEDLKVLETNLASSGSKSTLLKNAYGFHSSQIDPILSDYEKSAVGVSFSKPRIPVASTLTGNIVTDNGTFSAKYLSRQAREPVNFLGALETCALTGKAGEQSLWVEIGPEALCLGMIRSSLSVPPSRLLATVKSSEENWKTSSLSLSSMYLMKLQIDWMAYHKEYLDALTFIDLPSYAFDLKDYWTTFKQELLGPGDPTVSKTPVIASQTPAPYLSTCLQYVVSEKIRDEAATVTFVSHTSDSKLFHVIRGHVVDGVAICPASVFCEMAYTAAKYIASKTGSSSEAMSIHGLAMDQPIKVSSLDQPVKIEVMATKDASSPSVNISFSSSGNQNGGCQVHLDGKNGWKKEFSRNLYLVKKRADAIQSSSMAGVGHRLFRPIVYKLFSTLVSYGEGYQGIEEVFLDSGNREATARIRLKPNLGAGQFTYNPYWTDNLVHLAGFLLNADVTKPDDIAYIATALDDLYMIEELSESEHYTCYVNVQDCPEKKDHLIGDAFVFNGERLVALCAGISFHRMPTKILALVLGKSPSAVAGQPKVSPTKATNQGVKARAGEPALVETSKPPTSSKNERADPSSKDGQGNLAENLLNIVISESGFAAEDVEPTTTFADMGVDSMMSVAIISAAKQQMDLDLPANFFMEHATVQEMKQELGSANDDDDQEDDPITSSSVATPDPEQEGRVSPNTEDSGQSVDGTTAIDTGVTTPFKTPFSSFERLDTACVSETPKSKDSSQTSKPKARLVLLQGRASSPEPPLYLITDGAGSATAYIHIPSLPHGRRIYALESAYLSDPLAYDCDVPTFCALFRASIQEQQPHGPYFIGGWSAGAVYAYEVSRQLLELGERIQCLFLIDMRVPRPMTDALEPSLELIEQAGLVTGIKRTGQIHTPASAKLKQHLVSTVRALIRFHPKPMDPGRRPHKSFVVWAMKGISEEKQARMTGIKGQELEEQVQGKNVMEDEATGMRGWFFAKRKAFGPNGWDELVGDIDCSTMDADHFSMVQPPHVKVLGEILRGALKKSDVFSS